MQIRQTKQRHQNALVRLGNAAGMGDLADFKYVIVCIDGPESFNREASYSSSFNAEDTHKIFQTLADQTRAD